MVLTLTNALFSPPSRLTGGLTTSPRPAVTAREQPTAASSAEATPADSVSLSPAARQAAAESVAAAGSTDTQGNQIGENDNARQRATGETSSEGRDSEDRDSGDTSSGSGRNGEPLTEAEEKQVEQLKQRDAEVRAHEMAHKTAAGPYARGGPTYSYQTGPDGQRYAVGGSVQIDTAPVKGDPEATVQKMAVVRRAALAPKEPSDQDRRVAADASQKSAEAQAQMRQETMGGADAADRDAPANGLSEKPNASEAESGSGVSVDETADPSATTEEASVNEVVKTDVQTGVSPTGALRIDLYA